MKRIFDCLIRSLPLSATIIGIGYFTVYFILNNPQKLDFTLFVLGAIPIITFIPSLFSQSKSGAIHTPKVIFRKVDTLKKKGIKETENTFPALSYVLAGVLTWLFGLIIY